MTLIAQIVGIEVHQPDVAGAGRKGSSSQRSHLRPASPDPPVHRSDFAALLTALRGSYSAPQRGASRTPSGRGIACEKNLGQSFINTFLQSSKYHGNPASQSQAGATTIFCPPLVKIR